MDNEQLKHDLGKMMDQRFEMFGAAMDQRFEAFKVDISAVVTGNCAELHTQIQEVETRIADRLNAVESAVKRLSEAQTTHLKSLLTFMEWADRTDEQTTNILKRLEAIERRLTNPPAAA